jgi:5-methylcytosine-specific restriction endonuclease McrA
MAMAKKKICSHCGKMIDFNEVCSCKRSNNNEYKKLYRQKNKESLKPLSTKRWKKIRSLIIKRDKGCCQRCLIKYGIINTKDLQVHHIKPRIDYPELMFDESNLITLCKTCNLQLGTSGELDFEPNLDLNNYDFDFIL